MILQALLKLVNDPGIGQKKIHDFRKYKRGEEFFVDFLDSYNSARMISSILVKPGEKVIFQEQESVIMYCVTEIEYYSNSNSVQNVSLKIDRESEFKP